MKTFDCVIVGGGMVGAASALSLAQLGLTVALIEKNQPLAFSLEQNFDLRVSAISLSSMHLLEELSAWRQIQAWRYCPYSRLGVWEHASAYTEFHADDIKQDHLGYIVENRLLQLALWQQIQLQKNISLYCPETLHSFNQVEDSVELVLSNCQIKAKLLIAADGAHSKVRQLAGIGTTGWDYQQSAMLINVETKQSQQNITWQQFTATGPVAMLPLAGESDLGGYASLVWYHHSDEIKHLSQLSPTKLQQAVLQSFPERLGDIKVLSQAAFPLTRRHANRYQQHRVLLLGDAAHSINPMAGQGVNLGFKDVKALQTVIATAISEGEAWHEPNVLARYQLLRRKDNLMMMSTMDALYQTFNHPSPVVKLVRNLGLFMANRAPLLKNKALAYACGL